MALAITVGGIVVVMGLVYGFWAVVGPKVLVPHDGSQRYTGKTWNNRPMIIIWIVLTLMLIGIAVAVFQTGGGA